MLKWHFLFYSVTVLKISEFVFFESLLNGVFMVPCIISLEYLYGLFKSLNFVCNVRASLLTYVL